MYGGVITKKEHHGGTSSGASEARENLKLHFRCDLQESVWKAEHLLL